VRPTAYLGDLVVQAERRIRRLKFSVANIHPALGLQDQRRLSFAVVEAANLWTQFCRSFYLSTALRAVDSGGKKTSVELEAPICNRVDAITVAVQVSNRKLKGQPGPFSWSDEPKWQFSNAFLKVVRGTSCSNRELVESALSYQAQSRGDLLVARNFFAHKSQDTADKVRALAPRYSMSPRLAPAVLLASIQPGENQPVALNWLDDLLGTVQLMR
jgi:hypothetical protein